MFSSKSKPISCSPSRVSIEEANSHLKLVHQRVEQLETIISKQSQQLLTNEDNYKHELQLINQTYDKHVFELNSEIDLLKNRIKELELKLEKQNEKIIEENSKQIEKFAQILKLTPNLDKLLKLLNSLMINNNTTNNLIKNNNKLITKSIERLNGFCDTTVDINSDKLQNKTNKKSVKYKTNFDDQFVAEEVVSTASSSTTTTTGGSNQSPSVAMDNGMTGVAANRKSLNSKLRIGRSFNITSNFSDDEELVAKTDDRSVPLTSNGRRKKSSNV